MNDNPLDRAPVAEAPLTKRCPRCSVERSVADFYKNKRTGEASAYCRPCYSEYHRKRREADPEKVRAEGKRSYEKHREKTNRRNKERYWERRADRLAYAAQYREKNKTKLDRRRLEVKFGISYDQYEQMVTAQGGACALCGLPEHNIFEDDGRPQRLSVDHDHACCPGSRSCGRCVRGLLCSGCNSALGLMDDDMSKMLLAVEYLRRWKR